MSEEAWLKLGVGPASTGYTLIQPEQFNKRFPVGEDEEHSQSF